jgi:hypothetical protein
MEFVTKIDKSRLRRCLKVNNAQLRRRRETSLL